MQIEYALAAVAGGSPSVGIKGTVLLVSGGMAYVICLCMCIFVYVLTTHFSCL